MKSTLAFSALLIAFASPALGSEVVKTCSTELGLPGQASVKSRIQIVREGDVVSANIVQQIEGEKVSFVEPAEISEHAVREGLSAESNVDELNLAEKLVTHAIILGQNPELADSSKAGFDLTKVRSAKVYVVGKLVRMGMSAIIEAKDESGKDLGSFFGGFLVGPCK